MEERLIGLVKQNVYLYDKRYELYRNPKAKEKKWKEIATELCVPVEQVKGRWVTLRDRYHREKKIRLKASEDGLPSPKKKWKYFQLLRFLDATQTTNSYRKSKKYETEDDTSCTSSASERVGEHSYMKHESISHIPTKRIRKSGSKKLDEEFRKAQSEMSEILKLAKSSFQASSSSTQLFFASIAASIDEANLSLDVISAIKLEVQSIVNDEILQSNSMDRIPS